MWHTNTSVPENLPGIWYFRHQNPDVTIRLNEYSINQIQVSKDEKPFYIVPGKIVFYFKSGSIQEG